MRGARTVAAVKLAVMATVVTTLGPALDEMSGGVLGPGEAFADVGAGARPAVTVVPAERRLRRVSVRAREMVRELDGEVRARVLLGVVGAAREAGELRRFAFELQSVLDDHTKARNGDYLHKLYLAIKRHSARRALVLARELARDGVAIGPSAGHFRYLSHLDPAAPLPSAPANADAAAASMDRWVDAFVRVEYDLAYRPNRRGALSEYLQLTYADGATLDIDIRRISDSYDPAPAHAMAYAYIGPAERLFPLRIGRSTTPRLWQAKHALALAAMYRSNQDYETFVSISVAGVTSTLPLGLIVPVHPPAPRAAPRAARTATRAPQRLPTATSPAVPRTRMHARATASRTMSAARGLPRPSVADPKLNNLAKDLYKGANTKNPVGTGSTADAIRHEAATGKAVGGKFHTQKGREYARALEKWLEKNPNASASDRAAAQSMLDDLRGALGGK